MKILTAQQIRDLDKKAIASGISSLSLMDKAGEGVASTVLEVIKKRNVHDPIAIFAGKGNNGGDGLAAAYHLAKAAIRSKVFCLFRTAELSKDAQQFLRKAKACGQVHILPAHSSDLLRKNCKEIPPSGLVVDAVLGTGFKGRPHGIVSEAIDYINRIGQTVIAVDVPSGLDADTGKAEKAVYADITVTMGFCKTGFLADQAMNYIGSLRVADIGIPDEFLESMPAAYHLLDHRSIGSVLPRRMRMTHKGDYGHVLIVAGSRGMSGAAILSARAALRSGAGLVTVACPSSIQPTVSQGCTESMTIGLAETQEGSLSPDAFPVLEKLIKTKPFTALLLGPGIGRNTETQSLALQILQKIDLPLVVDADALYAIANNKLDLRGTASKKIILTPHVGEFCLLSGASKNQPIDQYWVESKKLSANGGALVVLKSHITGVINGVGGVYLSIQGNPGMSTGGSGDVLAGTIASFLAQGLVPLDAASAGVAVNAHAGDLAADIKGHYGLIASDIIEAIPSAILDLPLRR